MRKLRSDSYDAQLSESGRELLYKWLLEPDANLEEIQHHCSPWKSGPYQGQKPTIRTLQNIAARARAQKLLDAMEDAGEILQAAQDDAPSVINTPPTRFLNQICSLLAQEVLEKTVKRDDPRTRACLIRLLIRQQEVLIEKMRYQRRTAEDIDKWYRQSGPGKKLLEEKLEADYPERMQALGQLIFGDEWDPPPTPLRLANGTIEYPPGTGPEDFPDFPPETKTEATEERGQPTPESQENDTQSTEESDLLVNPEGSGKDEASDESAPKATEDTASS